MRSSPTPERRSCPIPATSWSKRLWKRAIQVTTVPGASAVLAALVVAGLPTDRFFFEGFLPPRSAARRERLEVLRAIPGTLVFFELPRRVAEMLADAAAVLGPRPAAVARELTKFFETVRRGTVETLAAEFASEATPKGEIVVLIGPPTPHTEPANKDEDVDARLRIHLAHLSLKDAVDVVAQETGVVRKRVYARAVELKKQ